MTVTKGRFYSIASDRQMCAHLHPSMGTANRWQTNTVMPIAMGASTCMPRSSSRGRLTSLVLLNLLTHA